MLRKITMHRISVLISLVMLMLMASMIMPLPAKAWYSANYWTVPIASGEDYFYNYDQTTNSYVGNTLLDWPVAMIFWNSATKTSVHNLYFGYANLDSTMYDYLEDGGSWGWDSTKGTKGTISDITTHLRVYGRNGSYSTDYSGTWGYYVIGTCHEDSYPWPWDFGYTENAEASLANWAASEGKSVSYNAYNCSNYEPLRTENDGIQYHHWLNSGYATMVSM